jgi:lycopene cyclase CruP
VVVLGGTLGILLATALLAQHQQQSGPGTAPLRVAVVERGKLQGRQQEWNVSHDDLKVSRCCSALRGHSSSH